MTLSLVEFLAGLKGRQGTNRNRVLSTLYYQQRYKAVESMTVAQIRKCLIDSRVPKASKMNIADVLSKSGHLVDSKGIKGTERVWWLTTSGEDEIRRVLGLPQADPEIEHDVGTLAAQVSKIKDANVREYVEEAVACLQVNCLRACVVFLWSAAMAVLRREMLAKGQSTLNAALQKARKGGRTVSTIDHFAYVKDVVQLQAAQNLAIIDKSQKKKLEHALDLRNDCGHPVKYNPGPKKVSAFVEDIVGIVF